MSPVGAEKNETMETAITNAAEVKAAFEEALSCARSIRTLIGAPDGARVSIHFGGVFGTGYVALETADGVGRAGDNVVNVAAEFIQAMDPQKIAAEKREQARKLMAEAEALCPGSTAITKEAA